MFFSFFSKNQKQLWIAYVLFVIPILLMVFAPMMVPVPNGFHQFYLGNHKKGIRYIVLFLAIPLLVVLVAQILAPDLVNIISNLIEEGERGWAIIYLSSMFTQNPIWFWSVVVGIICTIYCGGMYAYMHIQDAITLPAQVQRRNQQHTPMEPPPKHHS